MTKSIDEFRLIALTLPGLLDTSLVRAAIGSGEIGVLNGEWASSPAAVKAALEHLSGCARARCGIRVPLYDEEAADAILASLPSHVGWVILAGADPGAVAGATARLRDHDVRALVECVSPELAAAAADAGADGLVIKGSETGGWIGPESVFIALQRLRRATRLPLWVHGGIGSRTAAAAYVGGACGAVLDVQLSRLRESSLPPAIQARLADAAGSASLCLDSGSGWSLRAWAPPRSSVLSERLKRAAAPAGAPRRKAVGPLIGWKTGGESAWPVGQDAGLAQSWERHHEVGGALAALRAEMRAHLRAAARLPLLSEESDWAREHGTRHPIAQGPMSRVSDTPAFASEVAAAGALPFLALGMQREAEIDPVLAETRRLLGDRPWGVGLLAFLEGPLREEQASAVLRHRPPFALLAGGRPEQAAALEREGIRTYLHTPTPGLLKLFAEEGARRFVLEGRECGGHVGPLSSFVLWEQAAQALREAVPYRDLPACHVLLAGGIHDGPSAAMAAAAVASLAECGVRVGFLMGTAYLFTREAVSSGALLDQFQRQALACRETLLLETGPGHAVRCAPTPYARTFAERKARLLAGGATAEDMRRELEALNMGRLRLAAKGVAREKGGPDRLSAADEGQQYAEGLYMIGQAAVLRQEVCTVKELHDEIRSGAALLKTAAESVSPRAPKPAPPRGGIAIVGMGCLLPGARDLDRFWANILNKVDAISEVPPSRWDWKRYYDERREAPDRVYARWGGFLEPIPFDPASFGMPPSSLASIEPIQLLALETARAALRDAGCETRPFPKETTSVILGVSGGLAELGQRYVVRSELAARPDKPALTAHARRLPEWTEDSFAGILLNVIAGRIANRFDLGGPSFSVDAACASSLAAVYLACRELESGAIDMVLAGGADTFQSPFNYLCFCKTQALSPRGRCRTFDHAADGTCISEGLSMLVLKRVDDAERAGDRIYAVIRGVGASSDGRAKAMTAPSPEGQMRAMKRAYAGARVSPASVGLMEAHGTGTVAGDRAEIESLRRVFEAEGTAPGGVALGSVKSMIGHTKGAAGVTGMIKVALALHRKVLPATLGVEKPNESLAGGALYANAETRPWIQAGDGPRRGAVSAFGFGGANYHAVLEEYEGPPVSAALPLWPCELFLFREDTAARLKPVVAALADALKAGARPAPRDLAFTLWRAAQRKPGGVTLAVVATSLEELAARLAAALARLDAPAPAVWDEAGIYLPARPLARPARLAFLFPGQGSQYPDMLRELAVHFREVRETFEEADRALAGRFPRALSAFVFPPPRFGEAEERAARQELMATQVAQPALGAAALGLLRLLGALGVEPGLAAGHSYGEYAALCAAGALTPGQLLDLSESRGRFIRDAARTDLGTMAAVEADEPKTRALVDGLPDLWIANLNAPRQTILSGSRHAVAEALKRLEAAEVAAQPLPVACAFHCPLVAPAKDRLKAYLDTLSFAPPRLPVFSNTIGGPYPEGVDAIRQLLGEHLVSPVRFVDEIEALYEAGARVFVEVGPRSVLSGLTDQILGDRERLVVPLETRKRAGLAGLLHALGQLASHGVPVNLDRLFEGRTSRVLALDRLAEDAREPSPPSTAWWVDGGSASPMREPAPSPLPASEPEGTAVQADTAIRASAPGPAVPGLLQAHEEVMRTLLETHRRVMLAALGGSGSGAGPAGLPPAQDPPAKAVFPAVPAPPPQASPPPPQAFAPPAAPAPEPPAVPAPATGGRDAVHQAVLRVVGERTGYPPEMLDVNADLEADLGIDSIKRVEIAGRLRKAFPHIGATAETSRVGNLAQLKTLGALIDRIASAGNGGGPEPVPPPPTPEPAKEAGEPAARETESIETHVPRFTVRLKDAPPISERALPSRQGVWIVTDEEGGLAGAVTGAFAACGIRCVTLGPKDADFGDPASLQRQVAVIRKEAGPIAGLVHLRPLRRGLESAEATCAAWHRALQEDVKSLFYLIQAAAEDLRDSGEGRILAVIDAAGSFAGHEGVPALVNTVAAEWPAVRACTLALDGRQPHPALARIILAEARKDDALRFVRYHVERRETLAIESSEIPPGAGEGMAIGTDWVILLAGGATGITAQAALELAERYKPTLVLTGRSPLPEAEESSLTRGVTSPVVIRRLLEKNLKEKGKPAALPDVEAAFRSLLREREMRDTLAALRRAGARVHYLRADARDDGAFGAALDRVYAEHGRLDGVVFGAGVIEDRRIEDKHPESFDRVFDTKADGAFALIRHLRLETLKFAAFFSSVACLGNTGQSDYAAANGVLNGLARALDRRMAGRVVTLMWGPWLSAGMASEEVQNRFHERGVQLIPPRAGRRRFVRELIEGRKGEVAVILGDAPYGAGNPREGLDPLFPLIGRAGIPGSPDGSVNVECRLDPLDQRYLRDHALDGKPVFPAAMAMELLAEVARAAAPDAGGTIEVAALRVQKGIVLDSPGPRTLWVRGRREEASTSGAQGAAFSLRIETEQQSGGRAHYMANLELGCGDPPPRLDPEAFAGLEPFPLSVSEAYERWLFQGPCFAALRSIEGIRPDAVAGVLQAVPLADCLAAEPESRWIIDPTVLDASLQLVILWERHWHDRTPLPMQIGRFRLWEPFPSDPVRCLVRAAAREGGEFLKADLTYTDLQGRVLAVMEGLECACSRDLNRLSGHARAPAGTRRKKAGP